MLLKQYRQQRKLTQREVAKKIGVNIRQYQKIEAGEAFGTQRVINSLEDLFKTPQRILLAKNVEEVPGYFKKYLSKL